MGSNKVSSNESIVDSLENLLSSHVNNDTVKVTLLNDLTYKLYSSDKNKALNYALEAGKLADSLGFKNGLATSLRLTGVCYAYRANYPKAVIYYKRSIDLSQEIGNNKELALSLNGMGSYYRNKGNLFEAINNYERALEIFNKSGDKEFSSLCYNNIGLVYMRQANYPLALDYIQKSLQINEELLNEKRISICLNNIGLIYRKQENYPQALVYFERALRLNRKSGNERGIYIRLNNIGSIYSRQKEYQKALENYNEALVIIEKLNDKRGLSKCLNNIGIVYRQIGEYKKALEFFHKAMEHKVELEDLDGISTTHYYLASVFIATHKYQKALSHSLISMEISSKQGLLGNQKNTHKQLSEIYAALKSFKNALQHQVQFKALEDSIFNARKIKEIANLESQYKFEKEKQTIELEQQKKDAKYAKEAQKQRAIRNSFILGFILIAIFAILIFQSFIQKRKANLLLKKQKAEIESQAKELKSSNNKLMKLDLFKQNMTNMIAHDLKGPLGSIINIHKIVKLDPELKSIQQIGYVMNNLVMNMLDVYKYENVEMILHKRQAQLSELISSTFIEVDYMLKQKNISLTIKSDLGCVVELDEYQIKRVVVNILSNAVKYTPDNGKIWIYIAEVDEAVVKISIFNEGASIPQEILATVFDRFTHDNNQSHLSRSTGLGLTFCKMVVESHGGEIGLNSLPDTPVEAWFTLPGVVEFNKEIEAIDTQEKWVDGLNKEDRIYLQDNLKDLKSLEVYDVSELIKALSSIEITNSRIKSWHSDIKLAISNVNEKRYLELVNKVFVEIHK